MYPPQVIQALKEALKNVYWYKSDLRLFLRALELPGGIVEKQAWEDAQEYKIRIVGKIIDELLSLKQEGLGAMRRVIQAVLCIENFDHLRRLDDGAAKVQDARRSVEALRKLVTEHDAALVNDRKARQVVTSKIAEAVKRRNDALQGLQLRFSALVAEPDAQRRGFLFESFLRDLFAAYDLDPRGSFRITGEQIDGSFEFGGTQFLLEARWQRDKQGAAALDAFASKVGRKLENTLGLFIALNGYSEDGIAAFRGSRPSIILADGEDLALVLQALVDFQDLLKRKIRHASQTGDPYLRAREMIGAGGG